MEQNKTSKYLKYAIGEIVLVVIGILIALSINNWNENKKSNIKFNKLLVNVFYDLQIDLEVAQEAITSLNKRNSIANKVIRGKYSASDYRKNRNLINLIHGYKDFNVTKMGYNALMQNPAIIPSEYDQLISDLNKQYITTAKSIEDYLLSSSLRLDRSSERYEQNFPWYSQRDSTNLEKSILYYVNNPIYKNEVKGYQTLILGDYLGAIKRFYTNGLALFLTLKVIIYDTNALPSYFPKNADGFENVKSDYIGKYLFSNGGEISIKEINGFLFTYFNDRPLALLSFISKDTFKNQNNERILTFKRDESNNIIGWHNGFNFVKKVRSND